MIPKELGPQMISNQDEFQQFQSLSSRTSEAIGQFLLDIGFLYARDQGNDFSQFLDLGICRVVNK